MKATFSAHLLAACLCLSALSARAAETASLPMEDGREVVARVNGESLLLEDLFAVVAETHAEGADSAASLGHEDPTEILDRMIDIRLLVQEARVIGLDTLPEFRKISAAQRSLLLRDLLFREHLPVIDQPTAGGVEQRFIDAVEEVRMRALLIEDEAQALAFAEALASGRGFDELADEYVARGEAKEGDSAGFTRAGALFPAVRAALATMEAGDVSPVMDLGQGWAVLRLLERRVPANPEEREKAREETLAVERQTAVRSYVDGLRGRYAQVHRELLEGLDLQAESPGLDSYLSDQRVVAEVEGGEPVTVADLTQALRGKFFHGSERAAQRGDLDAKAREILDDILDRRVVVREALRLSLDETPEYRRRMDDFEEQILFGAFVQKVIEPNLEVGESDLRSFFEGHAEEYASPAMVRLGSFAFARPEDARAALERLRTGADPGWVRQNAEGQIFPSDDESVLVFGETPVLVFNLPSALREAVEGAASGEFRLVEGPGGITYVLLVREVIPSRTPPFEELRSEIEANARVQRRQQAVEEYARKLREVAEIELFAEGPALSRALLRGSGPPE